jgi:uncharacterized protein YgiM (DUF1202 family)
LQLLTTNSDIKRKGMSVRLYREVDHRVRYYKVYVYKSLFDSYLLERVYGSIYNSKPTRVIRKHCKSFEEASSLFYEIVEAKIKKGYSKIKPYAPY